jgi:hypothetical protein
MLKTQHHLRPLNMREEGPGAARQLGGAEEDGEDGEWRVVGDPSRRRSAAGAQVLGNQPSAVEPRPQRKGRFGDLNDEAEESQEALQERAAVEEVMRGNPQLPAVQEDEVAACEPCEDPIVRAVRDPGQPTRREIDQHELTHLPFRPWCADCVAGRAADDPHRRVAAEVNDGPPKVSVDYGFITSEDGTETRTILVMKVSKFKVIAAKRVSGKGRADPHSAGWLVDQLRRLGLGRCSFQADGEPAQRTFVKDVIEEACRVSNIGVAGAHSPAYDHQSNGAVEKAVRDVKDQVRVMTSALSRRVGAIKISQAVFDWMVVSAAELLIGAQVGHDGMTSYRRLRGRNWEPRIAMFGEQMMARRPRALLQGDAEPRWDHTTYLGTWWGTADHWVAGEDGLARKVRAVRRKPINERWSQERIAGIIGIPDNPELKADEDAVPPEVIPHVPLQEEPVPQRLTRGFRIEAGDLREHGYTKNCAKCDALRAGRQVGTGHSKVCRDRFEAVFQGAEDGRVDRALERQAPKPAVAPEMEVEPIAEYEWDMQIYDDPVFGDDGMAEEELEGQQDDGMMEGPPEDDGMGQQAPILATRRLKWADEFAEDDDDSDLDLGHWKTTITTPAVSQVLGNQPSTAEVKRATQPAGTSLLGNQRTSTSMLGNQRTKVKRSVSSLTTDEDLVTTIIRGAAQVHEPREQGRRLCYVSGMNEKAAGQVVTELFSPSRINAKISQTEGPGEGLKAGTSFDMIVDQKSGEIWDFLDANCRRQCW